MSSVTPLRQDVQGTGRSRVPPKEPGLCVSRELVGAGLSGHDAMPIGSMPNSRATRLAWSALARQLPALFAPELIAACACNSSDEALFWFFLQHKGICPPVRLMVGMNPGLAWVGLPSASSKRISSAAWLGFWCEADGLFEGEILVCHPRTVHSSVRTVEPYTGRHNESHIAKNTQLAYTLNNESRLCRASRLLSPSSHLLGR